MLLVVAVSTALAGRFLVGPPPSADVPARLAVYLDAEGVPPLDKPIALREKLQRVHEAFGVDLAVYSSDHRSVAAVGEPAPPPVEHVPSKPTRLKAKHRGRWWEHSHVVPFDNGAYYMVATYRWQGTGVSILLIPLVILFVLAVASWPLVRTIVRPLEKVTRAAKALGEGDLSARTGVDRADEVGTLAGAFDDMAARLQRLVDSEKELLANVSHELRTPIARIRVALELAADDPLDEARSRLREISQDLNELEQLVEEVLMASRLDRAAELPINRRSVSTDGLVERIRQRVRDLHPEHGFEAHLEVPDVYGDSALLRRLLDNLVDNAAKYSEPEAGPVEVAICSVDWGVDIEVRDRGIGVAEDDLDQLFDPFFRTDRSRTRGTGGVGLGLALCRRIVDAHSGLIEARRREGGGLVVRVWLPGHDRDLVEIVPPTHAS